MRLTPSILELVESRARAASMLGYMERSGSLWRIPLALSYREVVIRLHKPLEQSRGPWLGSDVGLPIDVWSVDAPTALLALLCLARRETLTSPTLASEADARAWAHAQRLSGVLTVQGSCRPGPGKRCQGAVCSACGGDPQPPFIASVVRPIAVRVGRCPSCVDGRAVIDCEECDGRGKKRRFGRLVVCQACHEGTVMEDCVECSATGELWSEVGRLVLDAAPRSSMRSAKPAKHGRGKCSGCGHYIAKTRAGVIRSHTGPGPGPRCSGSGQRPDTQVGHTLAVWADARQAEGDPLGRLISERMTWPRLDGTARDRWTEYLRRSAIDAA